MLILTFPYHRPYLPDIGILLSPLTVAVADWVALHVWGILPGYLPEIANDSTLLYVHVGNACALAGLGAILWSWRDRRRSAHPRLHYVLRVGARYFLATAMLTYGLVKVFKGQFYLPEPVTLYTTLGEVPRDLLFWSSMGTSRSYSIFMGSLEVLAGLLLLWRRTTLTGALLGLGIMVNVLAINLSFDISVKVFSMLLCLLCSVLIAPSALRLLDFLLGRVAQVTPLWEPAWQPGWRRPAHLLGKTLVVSLLLFDAFAPYLAAGNFNDDHAPRPALHGAYQVQQHVLNGDSLTPDLRNEMRWNRVFVHRKGFLGIQSMNGSIQDFALEVDTLAHRISFVDPAKPSFGEFDYFETSDSTLLLTGQMNLDTIAVVLKQLNWRALPLLKGEFHWTSDQL
ncbi:MAG TPA: hypothetical protein VHS96_05465, partial [Bacteroidia bacterium]|nr:hypothetical protein [Bacteroidia bacterium]